jgi:hypothetical protein
MGRGTAAGARYRRVRGLTEALIVVALLAVPPAAHGGPRCAEVLGQAEVAAALADIERSIDPCGETAEVLQLIDQFRGCARSGVRLCTDAQSERNFIERGSGTDGLGSTIIWNPELRSQLENGCDGDPGRPVLRDPTASLLHELVHAVQDCHGLEPSEHEFEAVRVENIYRRARHMCQRTRYGDQLLPTDMLVACDPGHCRCTGSNRGLMAAAAPAQPGSQYPAGDTELDR